jgi:hypothetical protein
VHTISIKVVSGKIVLSCTCAKTKALGVSTVDVTVVMGHYHTHLATPGAVW